MQTFSKRAISQRQQVKNIIKSLSAIVQTVNMLDDRLQWLEERVDKALGEDNLDDELELSDHQG